MNSLHHTLQKPILFVLLGILLLGYFSISRMQTSLFPDVVFPKITIIADNGDQPVDKMMVTVTRPLEIAVKRVNGIKTVRSSTNRGSCTIEAYFSWNTNIDLARTQLESRINEISNTLPTSTNIVIEAMGQSIYPVSGYTLESKEYGQVELKNTALYIIRPQFAQVPGISNVVVRGGKTKEYVITPDPLKMIPLGLTPQKIIDVMGSTNFIESNGLLSDYRRLYLNLTDTRINTLEDLRNTVIKNDGRRIIRLSDIAKVDLQEQQEFIRINANGHDAVIIDLIKQKGVNLLDFDRSVKAKAAEIQRHLPQGMEMKSYYDQSAFVSNSIDSVLKSIYEGLFLAILVVIFFLRSFRASLNIILIIPITLALTMTVLYVTGITMNIMSLGAIAASIGLIIDDAIVIIEQIHRTHEENPEKDRFTVVRETMRMLFPAMIGSSLSTIVIFLPFVMMSGVAGSFFQELTVTMEITLVCSFLVTWIGLPALHLQIGYRPHTKLTFLAKHHEKEEKPKLGWLIWFFNKPAFAIAFILLLGISSVIILPKLRNRFLISVE